MCPDWSIPEDVSLHIFYTGLDMDSADDLNIAAGGSFAHQTPTEGREILDCILRNSSLPSYPCEPQYESQSHHDSPSSAESIPSPSTSPNSSVEPSPEPRTSKEEEIQPLKFSSQFEDYLYEILTNTSNYREFPTTNEEWLEGMKRSSKAFRISSPSTTISCSIRGTAVEALHDPTAEACIMSEFLAETFVGSMPLDPNDRLFQSPSGLFFECRGIARAVPIKIDKIEVRLDFYVYPIIDFELPIGFPLENLLREKSSQGSLRHDSGETTFTTPISCPENPMAEHHDDHDPFKETMLTSPFISPNIASPPDPLNDALLKEEIREELSNRIIDFSEAVWIGSPSTTISCSIRGTAVEALHDPTAEACIMPEFLTDTFIGSMPLDPTNTHFRSPSGLFFECRGIARAVPVKIDKIEFCLDFHIYPIVDFDLLLGSPLENLLQEKSSQGSLSYESGETSPISYLKNPMVEHHDDHNPLEKMCHGSRRRATAGWRSAPT